MHLTDIPEFRNLASTPPETGSDPTQLWGLPGRPGSAWQTPLGFFCNDRKRLTSFLFVPTEHLRSAAGENTN